LDVVSVKSKNTSKTYENNIKQFFKYDNVENIFMADIENVKKSEVIKYISILNKSNYSTSTINNKLSSLSSLYKWLIDTEKLIVNPFDNLKSYRPKTENKIPESLSQKESENLINNINTETLIGLRDKTILLLALTTALRKSEILNIKIKDIFVYEGFDVIQIKRKGSKIGLVKIQKDVKKLINSYLKKTNRSEGYLFVGLSKNNLNAEKLNNNQLNRIFDKYIKLLNLDKHLVFHSLRHTSISLAINSGISIEKIRDFAGHSNISTTNKYLERKNKLEDYAGDYIKIIK